MAIIVLSRGKCGLSKCITCYLLAMAAADTLVVIFAVIFNRIIGIYFPGNKLSITPICRFKTLLVFATTDTSVWLTVVFTVDRYVAICCQKLKQKYCTQSSAVVIIATMSTLCYLKNIPLYFALEPLYTLYNVPWYCRLRSIYYTSPLWQAFSYFNRITTPFLPFLIILLLNALTVRYIIVTSKARKTLRGRNGTEKCPDPEMQNRKKSIILLFSISANFILLWLTLTIHYLYYRITNTKSYSGYNDPVYILEETGNMLSLLSCCTNTFIYAVSQKKFREELNKLMLQPIYRIAM
ncbi:probable G-protein coupled receptor 139 [Hypanus sabinus]|uniref:probable G-protein coupled receptor 139 n=1 Tax=Hypanus sabinus TaxID=79690 RepID=UPI0028C379AA|nr:probable G-protein coupled receptor 139 [Hypanus sabinus]